ncbi:MAG: hypothetical protein H7338_18225 [Candidatus Sericytochromatia bacterium]|nr:hypothetical protein [Candidatus Sericytochromatia bacterium]
MSINGVGPTINMRPSYEATYLRPNYYWIDEPIPPIGKLMGFDNSPVQAAFTGNHDGRANLLTRMGVDVAEGYSMAIAERHAPSGRVSHLA